MNTVWHSSYEKNNYGDIFYALVRLYKPTKVVELGTKAGYSAFHIARGLRANGKGTLDCYDLWEKYTEYYGFESTPKSVAQENLNEFRQIVNLQLCDVAGMEKKYKTVDILHIDLDNDGQILQKTVPAWIDKVRQCIIIEGGSVERDLLASRTNFRKMPADQWLNSIKRKDTRALKEIISYQERTSQYVVVEGKAEYKEKPISTWLKNFVNRRDDIEYFTFEPFPSITIIRKKL